MMVGDENPGAAEQEFSAAADQVADTARSNASEAATTMRQATEATAMHAEQVSNRMTEAAATASRSTIDAFGQARDRLTSMSAPFANPAFDKMRQGGEAFGKGMEASYATALEGMAEFNSKAIAAWRSNAEQAIEHWQNLSGVKSMSEAIALSAEHTRKQMETLSSQARELSTLATKIVRDAADPLKLTGR